MTNFETKTEEIFFLKGIETLQLVLIPKSL